VSVLKKKRKAIRWEGFAEEEGFKSVCSLLHVASE